MFLSNWLVFKIVLAAVTGLVDYPLAADVLLVYDNANKLYLSGGSLEYVSNVVLYKGETSYEISESLNLDISNEQIVYASDAEAGDEFGNSCDVHGEYAVVGASKEHANGVSDAGSVYVYHRSGNTWTQQAKLMASDGEASDYLGQTKESLAIYGDTVVVGALSEDTGGSAAGSAYVFVRSGTTWSQQAILRASNAGASDQFGMGLAIYKDTIVIGAPTEDTTASDAGSLYVFTRSGTTWTQRAQLQASNAGASDRLGDSVSIDGDTIIAGAYPEDTTASDAGSAYIFTGSGATWAQQAQIQASDAAATDNFGYSVSISGNTVVVGSRFDDDGGSGSGSAYVFVRSGTTWTQQAKLTASDAAASDDFGWAVDIDKDHIVVAAYGEDTGGSEAGAIYVFSRSGSTWTEVKKIQASNPSASDYLGYGGVGIHDGTIITSSPNEDTKASDAGAAYIYSSQLVTNYYISQPGTYRADLQICGIDYKTNEVEVTGSVTPEKSFNETIVQTITSSDGGFGICSIDGDYSVIGATGYDTNKGAVYVFYRNNGIWAQQARIVSNDYSNSITFGNSVAISGDRVIVGQSSYSSNSGKVEIFHRSGTSWTHVSSFTGSGSDQLGKLCVDIDGDYAIAGSLGYNTNTGRLYIYYYSNGSWAQQYTLDGESTYDEFGVVASISGDYIIVGARFDDDGGSNAGAAYIYKRTNTTWNLQNKFIGESASDDFGYGVAIYNEYAAIAAPGTTNGRLYIYKRTDTTWNIISKLDGPYTGSMGFDGHISMTDEYIIIGDHNNNITFVYRRSGETWSLTNELTGSGLFGKGVDISSSNDVIIGSTSDKNCKLYSIDPVAGLTFDNYNKLSLTNTPTYTSSKLTYGSNVYDIGTLTSDITIEKQGEYASLTFDTSSNVAYFSNVTVGAIASTMAGYEVEQIINGFASTTVHFSSQGGFGGYIDFNGDGTRMVLGASTSFSSAQGRAYVYHLEDGSWVQKVDIPSPNTSYQRFGDSVLMNEDGTRIAVNHYSFSKIHIYEYTNGAWPTSPTVSISTTKANGDMDMNKVGTVIVTGEGEGGNAAYIYTRDSGTGNWSLTKTWSGTNLGNGVAMNGAGTRVLIGQRNASGSHPNFVGKIYEANYDSGTSTWSNLTEVYASAANTSNWPTRIRMDEDGTTAVIVSGTNGQGRILERQSGTSWTSVMDVQGRCSFYCRGSGSMSYDGNMVLTGDNYYNSSQGRAYLYEYVNGSWSLTKTYENPDASPATNDFWGYGTAITKLKDRIAIGMTGDDTAGTDYGSVHIYTNAIPDFISFDTYNKLSLSGITNPTSKLHVLPTGAESTTTYDIGTATNIYIESEGTYTAEIKGATNFALSSNIVGAIEGNPLRQVATGGNVSLALTQDGFVYAWGEDTYGQMGQGTTDTNVNTPVKVKGVGGSGFLSNITKITVGGTFCIALASDGTLYTWGQNNHNQLGDGTTTERKTPVTVSYSGDPISNISAGMYHSAFTTTTGKVYAFGRNNQGQIGDNTSGTNRSTPTQVVGVGNVGTLEGIRDVSCGDDFTHAIKDSDGSVYGWGKQLYGMIGNGQNSGDALTPTSVILASDSSAVTGITQISGGGDSSLMLKSDGTVYACGYNGLGQIGNGTITDADSGLVQVLGVGGSGYLTGITQIAIAYASSLALKSDGTMYSWGNNYDGQNGLGTVGGTNPTTPVAITLLTDVDTINTGGKPSHFIVTKLDGSVFCWGRGDEGQIGDGTNTADQGTPTQVLAGAGPSVDGKFNLFTDPKLNFDTYNNLTFTGADTGSTYKLKYESNTYDLGTISNVYIAYPGTYSAEIKGATNFALSSNITGSLGTYSTLHDNVAISHTTGGGQTLVTVNNIKGNKTYKISFNKQWTDSHASYSTRLKMYIRDSSDVNIRQLNSIGDYLNDPRDGILLYDAGGSFDESAMVVGTGFSVDGSAGTHTVEITGGTYGSTSSPFTLADPWYFLLTMSTSDVITGKFFVGDTEVISHFLTRPQSGTSGYSIGETGNKFVFEFWDTATISGVNMTVEEYNPAPKLDFDGYNKLTFTGLESGSTSNVTFDGNTYSIGTASNVYISEQGTYEAESKGTTTFALTSNVVGTVPQNPTDFPDLLTYNGYNALSINGTSINSIQIDLAKDVDTAGITLSNASGSMSVVTNSSIPNGMKSDQVFSFSGPAFTKNIPFTVTDSGTYDCYFNMFDFSSSGNYNSYNHWGWWNMGLEDSSSQTLTISDWVVEAVRSGHQTWTDQIRVQHNNQSYSSGNYGEFSFKVTFPSPGTYTVKVFSVAADNTSNHSGKFNMLMESSVSKTYITPTSTTLKYGSNTYEIGTATNIYVENTGDYSAEIGNATDFALTNTTVSGTLKTVEPGFASRYQGSTALTYDGKLYAWGWNDEGEAGVGTSSDITVPTLCTGITQGTVAKLLSGSDITENSRGQVSAIKTIDGKIYMAGKGDNYLIPGKTSEQTSFTDVTSYFGDQSLTANTVTMMSFTDRSGVALTETGNVWTWGTHDTTYKALGQAGASSSSTPKQINFSSATDNITKVTCGHYHSLALDSSGDVWFWGKNGFSTAWPSSVTDEPQKVVDGKNIIGLASSYGTMYAWDATGKMWNAGNNYEGQIGDGTTTANSSGKTLTEVTYFSSNNITINKVYAGGYFVFADTSDGYYCWGNGGNGVFGNGSTGNITSGPAKWTNVSNIKKFMASTQHTSAITEDGKYYAWGGGTNYARGDNTTGNISYPKHIDTLPNILAPSFEFDGYDKVFVNNPPSGKKFTYIFEVAVASYDTTILCEVSASGYTIKESDITVLVGTNQGIEKWVNGIVLNDACYVASEASVATVGTKLFTIETDVDVTSFTIGTQKPKYMPGWKIYKNGVAVLTEGSNRGSSSSPEPVSYSYSLGGTGQYNTDWDTKYTKDTHTYDANQAQIITVSDPGTYDAQIKGTTPFSLKSATVPATSSTGLYTWAFHHGNFDNAYGDGDILTARDNGRFYADTPSYTGDIGTITPVVSSTSQNFSFTGGSWLTDGYTAIVDDDPDVATAKKGKVVNGVRQWEWDILYNSGRYDTGSSHWLEFVPGSTTSNGTWTIVGGGSGTGTISNGIVTVGTTVSFTQTDAFVNGLVPTTPTLPPTQTIDGTIYTFEPPSGGLTANVLMVAGGGGGGQTSGGSAGGGGAGGLVYTAGTSLAHGATKTIVVGNGGANHVNGNDTTFTLLTTTFGGGRGATAGETGGNGGSGGGTSHHYPTSPGTGVSDQGNAGGNAGNNTYRTGGGGGGAGGVGGNASTSSQLGGVGGIGLNYSNVFGSFYGESGWFAGGGAGCSQSTATPAVGGIGGGGYSSTDVSTANALSGQSHTGGGGGAAGGKGGSGIVLLQTNVATPNANSEVKIPEPHCHVLIEKPDDTQFSHLPSLGNNSVHTGGSIVPNIPRADGSVSNVYYASSYGYFLAAQAGSLVSTVEGIFYPIQQERYDNILEIGHNSTNDVELEMASDGTAKLYINNGANLIVAGTKVCFTVGKWHHIALTLDSGGNAVGYVNGYPVVSATYASAKLPLAREQMCLYRTGVTATFRKFLMYYFKTYNSVLNHKQIMQLAGATGLGPKLEYDGLNAINVVNTEPGSGTEITIYESDVNDTSNLYVVSCNESSYLLSNAGTYYAQIKGTDTFTITRPLTVTDDHFPLYQYPPIDGTTSGLTQSASADTWNTWTISGASNGNGQYQAKTTHAPHSISFTAYRAFNNDVSDDNGQYVDASQKINVGLTLQLPSAKTIRKYRMYPVDHSLSSGAIPGSSMDPTLSGGDPDYMSRPKSWILKGSNDDADWTDLDTVTDKPISIYGDVYSIDSPASYKYYQMFVVNIVDTSALLRIGEWQLWGDA